MDQILADFRAHGGLILATLQGPVSYMLFIMGGVALVACIVTYLCTPFPIRVVSELFIWSVLLSGLSYLLQEGATVQAMIFRGFEELGSSAWTIAAPLTPDSIIRAGDDVVAMYARIQTAAASLT